MSRQPRRPRLPREPRGGGNGAGFVADGAIPPPGMSIPGPPPRGFAFGSGAAAPARRGGPLPPTSASAPSPTTPAPAAAPTEPAPPPMGSPAPAVSAPHAASGYEESVRRSDAWSWRAERQPQPQVESQLVLVWASLLQRGFPPQSSTIWIRAVDPLPGYEYFIPGDAVCGENPDRLLWNAIRANRRKPTVAERFVGRIRAPSATGQYVELGGGDLNLPPEPPAQPTAWGPPANPWGGAPSQPYGGPGYGPPPGYGSPYGAPPPWAGAYGLGMPPWWGATQIGALAAQPPPQAVASDPAALTMWQTMQQALTEQSNANNKLMFEFFSHALKPAAAAPAPVEPLAMLERLLGITAKIREQTTPEPVQNSGVTVLRVDEDSTIVLDKEGNVNSSATGWANVKHAKSIVQGLRSWRQPQGGGAAPAGGAQPPRRQTLPAAGTNGAKAPEKAS